MSCNIIYLRKLSTLDKFLKIKVSALETVVSSIGKEVDACFMKS